MDNQGFLGWRLFRLEILVLRILGFKPVLEGLVRIAQANTKNKKSNIKLTEETYPSSHPIILSPIRGGAIIGVFMI
jgi:hypothetical protein